MDLKRIAKETAKVIISYLTYQAVHVVMGQLRETNLPRAYWLNEFATRDKLQDGDVFIENLLNEQADLALRIMTIRQHLAEEVSEFLPELVQAGIQQANTEHRKCHLERITQLGSADVISDAEADNVEANWERDTQESSDSESN